MFGKNIEEYDETQEDKIDLSFNGINDIYFGEYEKEVDMSTIFILNEIKPVYDIRKNNFNDLKSDLKDIGLGVRYKIKLFKLKNKVLDLYKKKKKTILKLSDYKPKIDENTINIIDIEKYNKQNEILYSDIHRAPYTPKIIFKKFFSKIKKNKKNINNKKIFINVFKYSFLFFFVLITYFSITFFEIKYTILLVNNIKIDNLSDFKNQANNLKNHIYISKVLLQPIFLFNYIFDNSQINTLNTLLKSSNYALRGAVNTIDIYEEITHHISVDGKAKVLGDLIMNNYEKIGLINSDLEQTISYLETIKTLNNPKYDKILSEKLALLKNISSYTKYIYSNLDLFLDSIGVNGKKTYLIAFQNSDELRPTGGFLGSVGIIDLYKGEILKFEKKDIYKLEFDIGVDKFKQKAPEGLSEISRDFVLRDGNYYADLASSSDKIKSFLSKTDYQIDGIIYINQNIILDALDIFGGVYFDKIGLEITKDNFSEIISSLVEAKISKTSTISSPKDILFDFINLFVIKIKNDLDYNKYLKLAYNSIEKKDLLIHFFDENKNKILRDIGIQKSYYLVGKDFNYPVFTSISGNKSDRYIKRIFEKNIKKIDNCNLETTFKITQKHTFSINDEIKIKNYLYNIKLLDKINLEQLLEIQGKAKNRQFVRIYIPQNATINSTNIDIKQKDLDDKKEISFFLDTQKLSTSEFELSYTLPYLGCGNYDYIFIKQPGLKNYEFNLYQDGNLINNGLYDRDYYYKN